MAIDSLGFLDAVASLPEQLTGAHQAAGAIDPGRFPMVGDIDHIVAFGMGGSGIAGDVLAAVGQPVLPVPFTVVKGYNAPAFIGPRTLVFALSYSGGTEETLSATEQALDRGARVVAITRGGALGELVAERGGLIMPCPEIPMPRAALGALVAPMVVTLFRMGLLPDGHRWLAGAQDQLARRRDQCQPSVAGPANPARELARRIGRSFPLVYGGDAMGAVAAFRWKADINENAKAPAWCMTYPELDHHEIVGWGQHGDVTRQLISLVELRHDFEHPQTSRRFPVTREIIEEALLQVLEVRAAGDGPLAQLLDLMYVADWASCYLALDNDVDPGPIEAIFRLKDALAKPE